MRKGSNLLVIDVGGTNVKFLATGQKNVVKIPSGLRMTPALMVEELQKVIGQFKYTGVSIGYPGPVVNGRPASEPHNLGPGWVAFDYEQAFGYPVKIINDAAMQALGSYEGGRMLFLGLGTGLGSALIVDGVVAPMELAHLPYRKGLTFEDYVGLRGLERLGKKKWRLHVDDVIARLRPRWLPITWCSAEGMRNCSRNSLRACASARIPMHSAAGSGSGTKESDPGTGSQRYAPERAHPRAGAARLILDVELHRGFCPRTSCSPSLLSITLGSEVPTIWAQS